ncbi:hypothetical protein [Aestuariispira insulae]|uniref:Uncharacterized protein n=1 Tax=Aestuariispira insulae TaxID=1461337 RepID=A0A3D9HF99_9PROT|nr:hypothetical protein [Aestuariispira insulae]RED48159.1 hypothetical protein DFP90_108178 [Aestuariispira insulae]
MGQVVTKEVGSIANQAAQRGIRNGWLASLVHIALVLMAGGFYHPAWDNGGMAAGAVFAACAMGTPLVMAVVGIASYQIHYRRLMSRLLAGDATVCRIWLSEGREMKNPNPNGCALCM